MHVNQGRRLLGRCLFVSLLASLAIAASPLRAAENPKIKAAMAYMKGSAEKLGEPKLEGENLYFGSTKVNGNFTVVDSVKEKQGAVATFFVKKGDGFVRVSTNVIRDGNRAVGTPLDPTGPVMPAIRQGLPFYGIVDILGRMFDTGYEPIKVGKDVIGIYFVGFPME